MNRRKFLKAASGLLVPAAPALLLPSARAQIGGLAFPGPGPTVHSGGGTPVPALVSGQVALGTLSGSGTSVTTAAFPNPVGVGNAVICFYGSAGTGNPFSSITDNQSNTGYTTPFGIADLTNDFSWGSSFKSGITNGPTTFTVTWTGARTFARIIALEFTNILSASPLDGTPAAQSQNSPPATANSVTSGNTTSTNSGGLVIAGTVNTTGAGTQSPGTGFTQAQLTANVTLIEYLIQGAGGAVAGTFTPTSAGDEWITGAYVLKHS